MLLFGLGFLIGDFYLQTFSQLPTNIFIFLLTLFSICACIALQKYLRFLCFCLAFLTGFIWSFWYASAALSWSLPKELEGKPLTVIGHIASLPNKNLQQTSFLFAVEKLQMTNQPVLIRLTWRGSDKKIKVGDKWQLLVKLKRIHATENPGAFDFEAWALQKNLRATGFVVMNITNKVLAHDAWRYPIDVYRQVLQEKIAANLPNSATSAWLPALIIGERNGIADSQWQILRNTGTNHLMAIAGLHIGIIAGFAYVIVAWCWRRVPALMLKLPMQQASLCAALVIAILFSALAGFSLPTQRACFMLIVFTLALLLRQKIHAWQSWSLAVLIVLLINPLSLLSESFWLSFGTIALIIYGMGGRLKPKGWWWKWGRVQWVIGIGLIPFSLLLFQQCSLISFIANSIAIPWLGFFILPFCLLSSIFLFVSQPLGKIFLLLADKSLGILWILLTWFSQLPIAAWQQVIPTPMMFLLTLCAFLFLLLPAGFPGRWLSLIWLAPLLLYKPLRPAQSDYWLTLLDVGQGLAVVLETKTHTLIYDAGPKFNTNVDMGASVVLPYLHTRATKKIDMLVISHGDNDHMGGARALLNALPVSMIKTSVPDKIPTAQYCLANESWQWDGVQFTFLYPAKGQLDLGNDSSCVLMIDNGMKRALLVGDIEKFAEKELLHLDNSLSADILVAPHHGSKTSAMKAFIAKVHPHYVLYATGYRNRYHFPHPSVMAAYAEIKAEQMNTTDTGAMQFQMKKNKEAPQISHYRAEHHRYWFD